MKAGQAYKLYAIRHIKQRDEDAQQKNDNLLSTLRGQFEKRVKKGRKNKEI